jgi:multiple sugar transport system permease protein
VAKATSRNLNNSVIVSIAATVLTLVFGTLAAYGLARFDFIGRRSFGYATLLLRTIPPAVLAVPVFVIWAGWHINDTLFGVTLIYVALNLPFTIWLLYGFIEQLPEELEEAAPSAAAVAVFWRVVLPLLAQAWPPPPSSHSGWHGTSSF